MPLERKETGETNRQLAVYKRKPLIRMSWFSLTWDVDLGTAKGVLMTRLNASIEDVDQPQEEEQGK